MGSVIPMSRLLIAPTLILLLLVIGFLVEFWPVVVALVALAVAYIGINVGLAVKRQRDGYARRRSEFRESIVRRNREAVELAKQSRPLPKSKCRQRRTTVNNTPSDKPRV